VIEFCGSLGLKFTQEEAFQALDEMETSGTLDGLVTIEECASQPPRRPHRHPPAARASLPVAHARACLAGPAGAVRVTVY